MKKKRNMKRRQKWRISQSLPGEYFRQLLMLWAVAACIVLAAESWRAGNAGWFVLSYLILLKRAARQTGPLVNLILSCLGGMIATIAWVTLYPAIGIDMKLPMSLAFVLGVPIILIWGWLFFVDVFAFVTSFQDIQSAARLPISNTGENFDDPR